MKDKQYEVITATEARDRATQERIRRELVGESAVKQRYYKEEKAAAEKEKELDDKKPEFTDPLGDPKPGSEKFKPPTIF